MEMPRDLFGVVNSVSLSQLNLFRQCPEKWRRRYVENAYEPPSGSLILGGAISDAETASLQQKVVSGEDWTLEHVLDQYSEFYDLKLLGAPEMVWDEGTSPGALKDEGANVLSVYHEEVAPQIQPKAVERVFSITLDDSPLSFRGAIDVETTEDVTIDLKVVKAKIGAEDALLDPQPSAYLAAKRAEGSESRQFEYHAMRRLKVPAVEVVPTTRSEAQLDAFLAMVVRTTNEMRWRLENEQWTGAPPKSWWCRHASCGYWDTCRFAGGV